MAYMNKIHRFLENTSKMTFSEKNKTFCVKIILLLWGTWKSNFKMKIIKIIIISHFTTPQLKFSFWNLTFAIGVDYFQKNEFFLNLRYDFCR